MFSQTMQSHIGNLRIEASKKGITAISFISGNPPGKENPNEYTRTCVNQLTDYFSKKRTSFDLVFDFGEATDFQKSVWNTLLLIPYGRTISYSELSIRLGKPKAIRAVGAANGKNPMTIVVPCHRVIGSDGSLIGYASGLDIKQQLLMMENPAVFGKQLEMNL